MGVGNEQVALRRPISINGRSRFSSQHQRNKGEENATYIASLSDCHPRVVATAFHIAKNLSSIFQVRVLHDRPSISPLCDVSWFHCDPIPICTGEVVGLAPLPSGCFRLVVSRKRWNAVVAPFPLRLDEFFSGLQFPHLSRLFLEMAHGAG